jgi:hypothetical protein
MHKSLRLLILTLAITSPCALAERQSKDIITIAVSPSGNDTNPGTIDHPFATLKRAKEAAALQVSSHDVLIQLADGTYRLTEPLRFTAKDGGRNNPPIIWAAAPNAHPVISGAIRITSWKLWNSDRHIYVADTPPGLDSRQLWIDDTLAPIASIELQRKDVLFTRQGITLRPNISNPLRDLQKETRLELLATGFFTKRIAPVDHVDGTSLVMRQPSWNNNLWGYDTIETPYHPELAHLYLANSLKLLSQPHQWFLDSTMGKLYLRLAPDEDISHLDVELPRISVLLSIGNSLDEPVQDLIFRGIRFSHTTWLGPSGPEGYASQQSGSFLTGNAEAFPADPIESCAQGCPAFESMRNAWQQMPASIQVSAAQHIRFENDIFAHLGQYALGIGNDADATLSGTGLGAGDITVSANVFTDCAGGAILVGGVQREAHHPTDPRQINREIIIRNNRIRGVSKDYLDNSAILSTYVQQAIILHNDISDVPYDAIDIGYGWGMHDPGGNPNYRVRMHGYDWKQNLVYQTPTTYRDTVVANNRIHGAKQFFHDGGAIYNLSASPGTLITENYIFDNNSLIGLYLDEGSRYITVRKNVVQDPGGEWLNVNTVHAAYPLRISPDNTAIDNWHDSNRVGGLWTNYQNNLILDDHLVLQNTWPAEAQDIMKNAGIEPSAGPVAYGDAQPGTGEGHTATSKSNALPD